MSDGEVKRFMAIVENPIFAYDDVRRLCVLESDHERVVAELKTYISDLEFTIADLILFPDQEASLKTIAKQAKVIEVLKACILKEDHRCGIWHDGRKAIDHVESIGRGET